MLTIRISCWRVLSLWEGGQHPSSNSLLTRAFAESFGPRPTPSDTSEGLPNQPTLKPYGKLNPTHILYDQQGRCTSRIKMSPSLFPTLRTVSLARRCPAAQPVIFKPVAFLACLRRRTRVSAQSPLTAVTPARESLGSDLSRGAGDYAPRDKPICAISYSGWTRCAISHSGNQEMNMDGFCCVRRP